MIKFLIKNFWVILLIATILWNISIISIIIGIWTSEPREYVKNDEILNDMLPGLKYFLTGLFLFFWTVPSYYAFNILQVAYYSKKEIKRNAMNNTINSN